MNTICVLGGGSVWTPNLIEQIAQLQFKSALQIRLHGPTRAHLLQVVAFAKEFSRGKFEIMATTDLEEAIHGATIIINQTRIGGWASRLKDELLPVQNGFVGDESLGLGGLRATLRAKPFITKVAAVITRLAPDAWLLNLSNPSDLVTRLWLHTGCRKVISLCSDAQVLMRDLAATAGLPTTADDFGYIGFSHIGWLTAADNVTLDAIRKQRPELRPWVERWNAVPTPWRIHLSNPDDLLTSQRERPGKRASELSLLAGELREAIREKQSSRYRALLSGRTPVWYSEVVVPAINGLLLGGPVRLVVGLPNEGSLLPDDPDVQVERWAVIDAKGVHPEPFPVNSICLNDLRGLGALRSLAFAVVMNPNRHSVESYAKTDALVGERFSRVDWAAFLELRQTWEDENGVPK